MSDYTIDESHNAWNQTKAADADSVFHQGPREVLFGTVHYWGDPAPTYEEVIAFFCNGPGRETSAHAVLEAGRVAWIVSPDDISWACGDAYGNVKSISIEHNPRASDEDYHTSAEEWVRLWGIYGKFPLVPHNHWTPTSCPGNWDVAKLETLATEMWDAQHQPAPTPAPEPTPVPEPPIPSPNPAEGSNNLYWTVEAGDTLSKIANYYGVPDRLQWIQSFNGIADANTISVGQKIYIPGVLDWTVESGDTLIGIANYYGMDVNVLLNNNPQLQGNPNVIYVGQVLTIQAG